MKLTPIDIQQQQFRSVLMGFDQKEVDAFLDLVASAFEEVARENNALKEDLRRLENDLTEHREREKTLKETLISATKIAEELKQGAQREAEAIVGAAELEAEKIVQSAQNRLVKTIDDINELKRQKAQFEGSLRSLIDTHSKLLEALHDRDEGAQVRDSQSPPARVKKLEPARAKQR